MNPDAPFSTNGIHKAERRPVKKNVPALVIALIAIPLLFLVVFPVACTIAERTGKPVFETPDEIDIGDIGRFEVQLQNVKSAAPSSIRKDDVGPYVANPQSYERLIDTLRSAKLVGELPPKVYLGSFIIQMKDGRQQTIRLSFLSDASGGAPNELAFKIGRQEFRGGPVAEFVTVAETCDPRPKKN